MMTPAVLGLVMVLGGLGALSNREEGQEWPNAETFIGMFFMIGGLGLIFYEVNYYFPFIK